MQIQMAWEIGTERVLGVIHYIFCGGQMEDENAQIYVVKLFSSFPAQ